MKYKDGISSDSQNSSDGLSLAPFEENIGKQMWKNMTCLKWMVLFVVSTGATFVAEKRRQDRLTKLPLLFYQPSFNNDSICSLMSCILMRSLRPSLFIGTRSSLNSMMAYIKRTPSERNRVREHLTMSYDGAVIALDWEFPEDPIFESIQKKISSGNFTSETNKEQDKEEFIQDKIRKPVVLILHGFNNDTTFGYVRSMMKACTNRGWVSAGMNYRGGGATNLATPRLSTSAYTNDLRDVVRQISSRIESQVPIFLIGFSMGANIVVKYLGEEGFSRTLPTCIAGAVSFANPMIFNHDELKFPWSLLFVLAAKKTLFRHRQKLDEMKCFHFQRAIQNALYSARSLSNMSAHTAPYVIRNQSIHPFATLIGYDSTHDLLADASSVKYIANVNVPLLQVFASDDPLVNYNSMQSLHVSMSNPNVIIAKTATGGHLGWHHAPGLNPLGLGIKESWCDLLAVYFFDAINKISGSQESLPPVLSSRL